MIARATALLPVTLALALVASGCGDDEGPPIPRAQANELIVSLREANRRVRQDPPVCGDLAEDSLPKLERQADELPEDTDENVRESIRDGIDYLRTQIEAECTNREEEPEETTTTTEEEPPPPTTEEEPPPPTTEEEPPPTTPTTPTNPDPGPGPDPNPDPDPGGNGNGSGGQGVPPDGVVRPKKQKDKD